MAGADGRMGVSSWQGHSRVATVGVDLDVEGFAGMPDSRRRQSMGYASAQNLKSECGCCPGQQAASVLRA